MSFTAGPDGIIEKRDRYRSHLIAKYRGNVERHIKAEFECLDPQCDKRTEIYSALCGDCERALTTYCNQIDKAIQRLTIMGEIEARRPGQSGGEGNNFARVGEGTNLTPASMLADELDRLATRTALHVNQTMVNAPEWSGYPGSYLANVAPYLARQEWVVMLLNGYEVLPEREPNGKWIPGEVVRGLKAIFADIRNLYPSPSDPIPPRPLPGVLCPGCISQDTLWLYPAQKAGQDVTVACRYRARNAQDDGWLRCGWYCPEDGLDFLAKVIPELQALIAANKKTRI